MNGRRAKIIRKAIFGENADVRVLLTTVGNKRTAWNDPQSLRAKYLFVKKAWKNRKKV